MIKVINPVIKTLSFPCRPQNMIDFISEVIRHQAIIKLNYQDGHTIRYSYKDLLWDTSNPEYPLIIQGEGSFSIYGYEASHPETWLGPHRLVLIEIVNGWV